MNGLRPALIICLKFIVSIIVVSLLPIPVLAQLLKQVAEPSDSWENLGRIYKGDENETVQEFWLLGRYHGQQYWADGSVSEESRYETRRTRFGAQTKLFNKLTMHAQAIAGNDLNPTYNGFTELWAQWSFSPALALTVGQQKNRFTHDRNVSSRYLNYLERSLLTNMFAVDYTPAVTLQGNINHLSYYSGVFTNRAGTNMGRNFTDFNSGYSLLSAAYYDLGSVSDIDSIFFHTSYLHSEAKNDATNMNRYRNGFSAALMWTKGSFSSVNELLLGLGGEDGSSYGINLQPGFFLTNSFQLVGRYQLALSEESKGLKPQRRYEREAGLPEGDLYHAGYLGLNYYIKRHRLKLMTGVEYADMSDEHVLTTSVMLRFYFGPHSLGAFPMNKMLHGYFQESD